MFQDHLVHEEVQDLMVMLELQVAQELQDHKAVQVLAEPLVCLEVPVPLDRGVIQGLLELQAGPGQVDNRDQRVLQVPEETTERLDNLDQQDLEEIQEQQELQVHLDL